MSFYERQFVLLLSTTPHSGLGFPVFPRKEGFRYDIW